MPNGLDGVGNLPALAGSEWRFRNLHPTDWLRHGRPNLLLFQHSHGILRSQSLPPCGQLPLPGNDTDVIFPAVFDFAGSDTRSGWTAGAGAEMAVMGNWTVKLEYDYIDFGTRSVTLSSALLPAITPTFDVKQVLHEVKLGVNYRFNVF